MGPGRATCGTIPRPSGPILPTSLPQRDRSVLPAPRSLIFPVPASHSQCIPAIGCCSDSQAHPPDHPRLPATCRFTAPRWPILYCPSVVPRLPSAILSIDGIHVLVLAGPNRPPSPAFRQSATHISCISLHYTTLSVIFPVLPRIFSRIFGLFAPLR